MTIATVDHEFCIRLPADLAARLRLHRGARVAIEEREGCLLIRPAEAAPHEPLEEFSRALKEVRASVRRAGGISERQIDEAIQRVRAEQADGCG
ncbi:MAG: AbrB/MazE/SpoVT family DNA-binding domain-containing protein [Armatimonadetes bacterium]|nr:AbrB/MazE/SpoVT family DNA-binding domain-containing protein [Armatimonadota bacterium]